MIERSERVEQFKADVAEMGIADPAAGRERMLLKLGGLMLVVGPVVILVAYFMSHGTSDPRAQRDAIVLGLLGVGLGVSGAALFLRYSIANFLRFWMARLIYEQKTQTDRIVERD